MKYVKQWDRHDQLFVTIGGKLLKMWHDEDADGLEFFVLWDGVELDGDDEDSLADIWAPIPVPYETLAKWREESFQRHLKAQERKERRFRHEGGGGLW